jgi:hypothetical protein
VGNNFGADPRKTIRADAVGGVARPRIAGHAPRIRQVPGANASELQPMGQGRPQRDGMENEPKDRIETILCGDLGVETVGATFPQPQIRI